VYNEAIAKVECEWLVFVHDDVWLDDFFLVDHVRQGMREFHVLGVAGNRRCLPGHTGWAFINRAFESDGPENLSGSIALGERPFGRVLHFGPVPEPCELLDGVFLAADREALIRDFVSFDPRFDFHFYDLDFCRSARRAGLKIGTWSIPITHASPGAFGSPEWESGYAKYTEKWGE
jgi:GT2 family glycosyltransferase